ncbi:MAG: nucleoside monophosphate kinase [Candidatus ainarchaeum sp.]|nr:nucleoside monophosphate kinase [Candidatus ainarchaeum sp.]
MLLLFFGPSGVGKGTYARMFVERNGFVHVSTGDILRAEVASGSKLGKEVEKLITSGKFVPQEMMNPLLKAYLEKIDYKHKKVILDGYPRSLEQAEGSKDFLNFDYLLSFEANEKTLVDRLSKRWTCPKCGEIYHEINIPPKVKWICDKDGAKLFQRDDDKPEAIKSRLNEYKSKAEPVLNYYPKKKVLRLSADEDMETVYKRAIKVLKL